MYASDLIPDGVFSDLPDIVSSYINLGFSEFSMVLKSLVGLGVFFILVSYLTRR